jgi:hypothetical protein
LGVKSMIERETHPVGWALLMYELDDAHDHLGNLLKNIAENPEFSEGDLRVELGHVYAHLNRAWSRRNVPDDLSKSEWEAASEYPSDLDPIG